MTTTTTPTLILMPVTTSPTMAPWEPGTHDAIGGWWVIVPGVSIGNGAPDHSTYYASGAGAAEGARTTLMAMRFRDKSARIEVHHGEHLGDTTTTERFLNACTLPSPPLPADAFRHVLGGALHMRWAGDHHLPDGMEGARIYPVGFSGGELVEEFASGDPVACWVLETETDLGSLHASYHPTMRTARNYAQNHEGIGLDALLVERAELAVEKTLYHKGDSTESESRVLLVAEDRARYIATR